MLENSTRGNAHVSTNTDNKVYQHSRIVIHHRYSCIIQTHGIGVTGPDTRILIDPTQDLLVPNQAVFLICNPIQKLVLKPRLAVHNQTLTNDSHLGS